MNVAHTVKAQTWSKLEKVVSLSCIVRSVIISFAPAVEVYCRISTWPSVSKSLIVAKSARELFKAISSSFYFIDGCANFIHFRFVAK